MNLIFIASVGRSGSTALDAHLIRTLDSSVSIGESFHLSYPINFGKCACSTSDHLISCFWDSISIVSRASTVLNKKSFYNSIVSSAQRLHLNTIVDSSKSFGALKFLHKYCQTNNINFYVIVLKRDKNKVLSSSKSVPKTLSRLDKKSILIPLKLFLRNLLGCRLQLIFERPFVALFHRYSSRLLAFYDLYYCKVLSFCAKTNTPYLEVFLGDSFLTPSIISFANTHRLSVRKNSSNWRNFFHNRNGNPSRFSGSGLMRSDG